MKKLGKNIVNFRASAEQMRKIQKIKEHKNFSEFLRNNIDLILDAEILKIEEIERKEEIRKLNKFYA